MKTNRNSIINSLKQPVGVGINILNAENVNSSQREKRHIAFKEQRMRINLLS